MKIYITDVPGTLCRDVYLISENARDRFYITFENGELLLNALSQNGAMEAKPLFRTSNDFAHEMVQAFAEYAEKHGIDPTTENGAKRELLATKFHLADLRQLLKLK